MSIAVDAAPALIKQCAPQVAPETVAALIQTESGGNAFAININYRRVRLARRANSLVEAIGWAKWLIQNGYNIDMGLMQVNSRHLPRMKLSVEKIFDPCTNIRAGSHILTENYLRAKDQYGHGQNALFASLSAYNTGNFKRGFHNGYVRRVVKNAGKPVVIRSTPRPPSMVASSRQASNRKVSASASRTTVAPRHLQQSKSAHANVQSYRYFPPTPNSASAGTPSPHDANTGINVNTASAESDFAFVR